MKKVTDKVAQLTNIFKTLIVVLLMVMHLGGGAIADFSFSHLDGMEFAKNHSEAEKEGEKEGEKEVDLDEHQRSISKTDMQDQLKALMLKHNTFSLLPFQHDIPTPPPDRRFS